MPCSRANACWPGAACFMQPLAMHTKKQAQTFTLVGAHDLISCLGYPPTPAKAGQLGTRKSYSRSTV